MVGGDLGGVPAEEMTLTRPPSGLCTATSTLGGLVRFDPSPVCVFEDDR